MPLYDWKSKSTGKVVSVVRSFETYQDPPTEEESDGDQGPWVKQIGNPTTVRSPNWGKKGYW